MIPTEVNAPSTRSSLGKEECALPYGLNLSMKRKKENKISTPGNFYINFAHAKHASIIN